MVRKAKQHFGLKYRVMGNQKVPNVSVHDEGEQSPIHGDLLEVVMSEVPMIDLVSASRVSKSWDYAVFSSLSHFKKPKPWIVVHTQNTISLAKSKTHAYDPRSKAWIEIIRPPNHSENLALRSSCSSTLVYEMSNKELAFSVDPLHHIWHHIPSPKVWRVDPIVALVGSHVIVAGGASYFEEDPLSVEMYDMETSNWSICQSIPNILKDSTTSTWLSIASNQKNLYVTQKASGITYSFSPKTKTWSGPYDLSPNSRVFFSTIEYVGNNLILAGLIGHAENVKTLKIWKIKPELEEFNEIAEIPTELLEKLKEGSYNLSSISLLANDNVIYIYKDLNPKMIISCEYVEGKWKWGSVENMIWDETRINDRLIMSCTKVGIFDLHKAMKFGNCKFVAKSQN